MEEDFSSAWHNFDPARLMDASGIEETLSRMLATPGWKCEELVWMIAIELMESEPDFVRGLFNCIETHSKNPILRSFARNMVEEGFK